MFDVNDWSYRCKKFRSSLPKATNTLFKITVATGSNPRAIIVTKDKPLWIKKTNQACFVTNSTLIYKANELSPETAEFSIKFWRVSKIITLDVIIDFSWYRIYYFPNVNNMNDENLSSNALREIYISIQWLY